MKRTFLLPWLLTAASILSVPSGRQTAPLEEVVLAQAFQLEALLNVLERRGVIWKAEVLREVKALLAKTLKGR